MEQRDFSQATTRVLKESEMFLLVKEQFNTQKHSGSIKSVPSVEAFSSTHLSISVFPFMPLLFQITL